MMEINKYLVTLLQEPGNLVVERREARPVMMNAFELISTSQGLNLGTLFEKQMVCCEVHAIYSMYLDMETCFWL